MRHALADLRQTKADFSALVSLKLMQTAISVWRLLLPPLAEQFHVLTCLDLLGIALANPQERLIKGLEKDDIRIVYQGMKTNSKYKEALRALYQ